MESVAGPERQLHDPTRAKREEMCGDRDVLKCFRFRVFPLVMALSLLVILYFLATSDPLGLLSTSQDKRVDCVAFSPDANYLAARLTTRRSMILGWNKTMRKVQLFHLGNNPERRSLTCYSESVPGIADEGHCALAFSADGTTLAVARDSKGGGVDMWDLRTYGLRRIGTSNNRCFGVTFLPHHATLASVQYDTLTIHSLDDGEERHISRRGRYGAVVASPDGALAVVAGGSIAEVWRLEPTQFLFQLVPCGPSLSISPDGKTLAAAHPGSRTLSSLSTGTFSYRVFLFDLRSGKASAVYNATGPAVVSFSPDGCLAVACGTQIQLIDPAGVAPARTFTSAGTNITSVTFSSNGGLLAAGGEDGSVMVWDVKTGFQSYRLWFQDKRPRAFLALAMLGAWLLCLCCGTFLKRKKGREKAVLRVEKMREEKESASESCGDRDSR